MPLIKRYSNRKLYDTQSKRYIKLEDVAELIRDGQDVRVTDHETGADITALVQAQTILELEKRLKGGLPGAVLTKLIRAGGDTLSQLREAFSPEDIVSRFDAEIEQRIRALVERRELDPDEGARVLDLLLSAVSSPPADEREFTDAEIERTLHERGIPSPQDWKRLIRRLDELNAEMEQLTAARRKPSRSSRSPRRARPKH